MRMTARRIRRVNVEPADGRVRAATRAPGGRGSRAKEPRRLTTPPIGRGVTGTAVTTGVIGGARARRRAGVSAPIGLDAPGPGAIVSRPARAGKVDPGVGTGNVVVARAAVTVSAADAQNAGSGSGTVSVPVEVAPRDHLIGGPARIARSAGRAHGIVPRRRTSRHVTPASSLRCRRRSPGRSSTGRCGVRCGP